MFRTTVASLIGVDLAMPYDPERFGGGAPKPARHSGGALYGSAPPEDTDAEAGEGEVPVRPPIKRGLPPPPPQREEAKAEDPVDLGCFILPGGANLQSGGSRQLSYTTVPLRGKGSGEAVLSAHAEGASLYDEDSFLSRIDNAREMVSTGHLVNTYTGEVSETYEDVIPPPDRSGGDQERENKSKQLRLQWAQGDKNHKHRAKRELEVPLPDQDSGEIRGVTAEISVISNQVQTEALERWNRDVYFNRTGLVPAEPEWTENPYGFDGYNNRIRIYPHMPALNDLDEEDGSRVTADISNQRNEETRVLAKRRLKTDGTEKGSTLRARPPHRESETGSTAEIRKSSRSRGTERGEKLTTHGIEALHASLARTGLDTKWKEEKPVGSRHAAPHREQVVAGNAPAASNLESTRDAGISKGIYGAHAHQAGNPGAANPGRPENMRQDTLSGMSRPQPDLQRMDVGKVPSAPDAGSRKQHVTNSHYMPPSMGFAQSLGARVDVAGATTARIDSLPAVPGLIDLPPLGAARNAEAPGREESLRVARDGTIELSVAHRAKIDARRTTRAERPVDTRPAAPSHDTKASGTIGGSSDHERVYGSASNSRAGILQTGHEAPGAPVGKTTVKHEAAHAVVSLSATGRESAPYAATMTVQTSRNPETSAGNTLGADIPISAATNLPGSTEPRPLQKGTDLVLRALARPHAPTGGYENSRRSEVRHPDTRGISMGYVWNSNSKAPNAEEAERNETRVTGTRDRRDPYGATPSLQMPGDSESYFTQPVQRRFADSVSLRDEARRDTERISRDNPDRSGARKRGLTPGLETLMEDDAA